MKYRGLIGPILLSSLTMATAAPAGASPTVVELFTSQGCSSCPPANANLIRLSNQTGVLALSFSVTYWDYLGWKDTYGKPEFTQRQVHYEPTLHQEGPYTPQMVVNGSATAVGNNMREIQELISETPPLKGPILTFSRGSIEVGARPGVGNAEVWLVRYDPQIEAVPVARGENTGSTLQHTHVVRRLQRLGDWSGEKTSFRLPGEQTGLRTAVLVQRPDGGAILSAITD